jgi:enoyl-CoA hydratase/carnithine racemase
MSDLVLVDRPADDVARVTLNRPEKKNALSIQLRDEVSDALDALAADESVKVVIVTGAGDTFSAGFDLKEFDGLSDAAYAKRLWDSANRFHRVFIEFPLPLVAAVNGAALAGGFDVAVMCDIRIAAETSRFAHPEQTFSDVLYGPLYDLVGGAVARDLCFTGRPIEVAEAYRLGIVSRVVPGHELEAAALETAGQIVRAPRDVLRRTKAKAAHRAGLIEGNALDL